MSETSLQSITDDAEALLAGEQTITPEETAEPDQHEIFAEGGGGSSGGYC